MGLKHRIKRNSPTKENREGYKEAKTSQQKHHYYQLFVKEPASGFCLMKTNWGFENFQLL